jgi:hypothetical protein
MTPELPFIEISVVQTTEKGLNSKQILEIVQKKFEHQTEVECSWTGSSEQPILRVEFPSNEVFDRNYKRDLGVYEAILREINQKGLDPKSLFPPERFPVPNNPELYLILRYRTNRKDPIRKNYSFTNQFAQMMNVFLTFEEVEDGFLNFYKRKDDFLDAQFDKTKPENVILWFQKRGVDPNHPILREFRKFLNQTAKPTPVDAAESL